MKKLVVSLAVLALLGVGYPTWVGVRAFNWFWAHLINSNVRWNLGPVGLPAFARPPLKSLNWKGDILQFKRSGGCERPQRLA